VTGTRAARRQSPEGLAAERACGATSGPPSQPPQPPSARPAPHRMRRGMFSRLANSLTCSISLAGRKRAYRAPSSVKMPLFVGLLGVVGGCFVGLFLGFEVLVGCWDLMVEVRVGGWRVRVWARRGAGKAGLLCESSRGRAARAHVGALQPCPALHQRDQLVEQPRPLVVVADLLQVVCWGLGWGCCCWGFGGFSWVFDEMKRVEEG